MRILVVEDEKKLAEMVARGLKAERYAIDTAHDGESGWQMANTHDYDLTIRDSCCPASTAQKSSAASAAKIQPSPSSF